MNTVIVFTKVSSFEDGEVSKPIKYNNQQNGAIKGKIISASSTTVSDGKYLVVTTTVLVEES